MTLINHNKFVLMPDSTAQSDIQPTDAQAVVLARNIYGKMLPGYAGQQLMAEEDESPGLINGGADFDAGSDDNDADDDGVDDDIEADDDAKEEAEITTSERLEATEMSELNEQSGPHARCFRDMSASERDSLREKKDTLAASEAQGGPGHELDTRNAKLDLAIEKAEIIQRHSDDPDQIRHAGEVADAARREQAMLGKVQLGMDGKPADEQQAMIRQALTGTSGALPAAATPAPANLAQPGGLQTAWQQSLDRTTPILSQAPPSTVFAPATPPPPAFGMGGMR